MGEHSTWVIKNGRVLLANGELVPSNVLVQEGQIHAIGPNLESARQIDAAGGYVLPGLIDLHTHGIRTESADTGTLQECARIEASRGTTTFYPTLFGPPEQSAEQMVRHRLETEELRLLPQIGGFRLESPYLARTGAGIANDLAPIGRGTTERLLATGGGLVKIWDISPELAGAPELVRQLSERGIVCSIAHTRATIAQARAVIDAGARLVTHLFDTFVMPEMTDPGVYPAGLVDYLLVEDRVTCEIIGDGTHVHPLLVEKAFRCKPKDRIAFVTDSNFGAGLPPGRYTLPGGWGNVVIGGPNDGVRQVDRDMGLAGSALTPIDGFRNVIRLFHRDIATASRVWSGTPARLMGLNKGEIAVGRDADLIILDERLEVSHTIVRGEIVYTAPSTGSKEEA
jgi:N-acetylglucosamine-6-phosphate deacetylase